MAQIDEIVQVTVTAQTSFPTQLGFGTPLLLCCHDFWAARLKTIAATSELTAFSVPTTHPVYRKVNTVFSQNPRPDKLIIGKRTRLPTQIVQVIPRNLTPGFTYAFTYESPDGTEVDVTYTNGASETVSTIVIALNTALAAIAGATAETVPSSGTRTHELITSAAAGDLFNLKGLPNAADLAVIDVSAGVDIAADLNDCEAAEDEANSFYGVTIDTVAAADIEDVATWVASRKKIAVCNSVDWDTTDPDEDGDIMSTLEAATTTRCTVLGQFVNMLGYSADAWVGKKLPSTPGRTTWFGCSLAGVTKDSLSTDQTTAIAGKHGNYYVDVAGLGMVQEGWFPDGTYIDQIHGRDWMARRIQEKHLATQSNLSNANQKVPFTDKGIDVVVNDVSSIMSQAADNGIVIPAGAEGGWTIKVPKAKDVPLGDKAVRTLRNVVVQATEQGAIHRVRIQLNISL